MNPSLLRFSVILACVVLCIAAPARAQFSQDLALLSIEELMEIEVFTASRGDQQLARTAAAATVLTSDDLRRAGVTTIPDALRLVPGMEVARMGTGKWAVTARGFNDQFANKLQVLVDGRSVYTPLFSGVFWDQLDLPMADIERIEVVRGPGASLWGANAVNGIVNIITRSAADDQGTRLTLGSGSVERLLAEASTAGQLGSAWHYRVFARGSDWGALGHPDDGMAHDAWRPYQGGFRLDGRASPTDSLTLQGGGYEAELEQTWFLSLSPAEVAARTVRATTPVSLQHLQARWTHGMAGGSDVNVRVAWERAERAETPVDGRTHILDTDIQQQLDIGTRHRVTWGLGYRRVWDHLSGSFAVAVDPPKRSYVQISAFAQSTTVLHPEVLELTLGSKVERFDLGGVAVQPNARLLWTPDSRRTLWAAISRAVRTPARGDHDLRAARLAPAELVPEGFPTTFLEERGSRDFEPEEVTAYEFGVRGEASAALFIDVALYYNVYDRLRTSEPSLPQLDTLGAVTYVILPLNVHNRMSATTQGLELSADWRPLPGLRLQPAWTWRSMDIDLDKDSSYLSGLGWEGVSPEQQFVLRASVDIASDVDLNITGRYVGALPDIDVDSYVGLDLRLAWRPRADLEIAAVGNNLLQAQHAEFRVPHVPGEALDPIRAGRVELVWWP